MASVSRKNMRRRSLNRGLNPFRYVTSWLHRIRMESRSSSCVRACVRAYLLHTCVHARVTKGMPAEITDGRSRRDQTSRISGERERERETRRIARACSPIRTSRQRRASLVGPRGVVRPRRDDVTRHTTPGRARKTASWPKPELHARKYNDPFVAGQRNYARWS